MPICRIAEAANASVTTAAEFLGIKWFLTEQQKITSDDSLAALSRFARVL